MKTITSFFCWFVCVYIILKVQCLHSVVNGGNWLTIYVDCNMGNDTSNCGLVSSSSCKTLLYVISKRLQEVTTNGVVIRIASGDCSENTVLRLDDTKTKISLWSFVGSNETSRPTIVHFSVESFNSDVSFSYIEWRNLRDVQTSFNIQTSKITFDNCILKDINFHLIGLNTNFVIQNTAVINCASQNPDIPLFFLQTLYNYETSIFIQNSTFSHNKNPIIYAMKYHVILMTNTLFDKNGNNVISNSSLVTVSASLVTLKNSRFNHNLGTVIAIKNVKNFTSTKVMFLSNTGSLGSCFLVKRHSKLNLVDTSFQQNTNPVVFVNTNDDVNITFKRCHFDCIQRTKEINLPFMKTDPAGANITVTNCFVSKSCSVHCKNGELVKSNLYCEKCHAGSFSYSENGIILSESCQSCPAGTYASGTGRSNCSLCAQGTYAKKTRNKECKKCTNDFFTSDAGAKSCSKMTLELILITAATIPLIIIPLALLLGRFLQKRSLKLRAQLQSGRNYGRFKNGENKTTNAEAKDFLSQGVYSNY